MIFYISTSKWELEKKIKQAWKYYKTRAQDCHVIAQRVKQRGIDRFNGHPFAYPEEITKFDRYAREMREVEEYIAVRQKEINKRDPRQKRDNLKFNTQQVERLRNELTIG